MYSFMFKENVLIYTFNNSNFYSDNNNNNMIATIVSQKKVHN